MKEAFFIPPFSLCSKGYHVTFDQDLSLLQTKLSKAGLKQYTSLYEHLMNEPAIHLKALEELILAHPDIPQMKNLQIYAYLKLRNYKKGQELTTEIYEKHPDYLFAKISYAHQCLKKGKADSIPAIFNHTFDLNFLYPKRSNFHFSEMIGFLTLLGSYFYAIKNRELAEELYQIAFTIDPFHPNVVALEKKVTKKRFKLWQKLALYLKKK